MGKIEGAWLLGDRKPCLKLIRRQESKYIEYRQDSICGAWECLADIICKGGVNALKKSCPTYREIGKCKAEWAENIGIYMKLDANRSPSFNFFIRELRNRITTL